MRFKLSLFLGLLLATTTFATQHSLNGVTVTGVRVVDGSWGNTTLEYTLAGFDSEELQIDGDPYYRITTSDAAVWQEAGAPALPRSSVSIVIPDQAGTSLEILASDYTDFTGLRPEPSKGVITRDVDPATVPYTFGAAYDREIFPAAITDLSAPYIMRDFRGQVVHFQPFQWLPQSGALRVYSRILVRIATDNRAGVNEILRAQLPGVVDGDFNQIYRRHFVNFVADERYTPLEEQGNLLIITNDAFHTEMEPFLAWKLQKGIPTELVDLSTIGYTSTAVQNYVQNYYDTIGLTFLLLVGDAADVPTPSAAGGSSDPTYSLLAGSDTYPEIFVGRFSGETPTQVATMVERTIEYERNAATATWYHKGTGVASNQGPGDDGEYDNEHMDNIRLDLLGYTYTVVDQIYDPTGTAAQVSAALNDGRSIVNYCGHGSTTSWGSTGFSNTHVNSLTNNNMLPFIQSVACVNGQFNGYTCFAEAWLRATNGGEPTGAVAMYASSINQSWNSPMCGQDEMIDLLTQDQKNTYGGITFNGSMQMMDEYGSDGQNMFLTWHIFGDPSVQLRTDSPAPLSVTHAGAMFPTAESYEVTATGVDRALCALYGEGVLYGYAYTNAAGNAVIPIDPMPPVGQALTLTVTAYNYTTHQSLVDVIPPSGPYVVFDACTVEDANGELNPGESPALTIALENVGVETAVGVYAVLTTTDPYVTVLDGDEFYGDMVAGAVVSAPSGFQVQVAAGTPEDHLVSFTLTAEAAGEWSWDSHFDLTVRFIYEEYWSDDCEAAGDWTHSAPGGWVDQWHLSSEDYQSPTHSWKCGDTGTGVYANLLDARLVSPLLEIRPYSRISFLHRIDGEVSGAYPDSAYDGGICEISVDGLNWTQATPSSGGYNKYFRWESGGGSPATHPFNGGTPCWSGSFGWQQTEIALGDYADQTIQLRFRFGSDQGGGSEGWYLDDFSLVGIAQGGELDPVTDLAISVTDGFINLTWSPSAGAISYNIYGAATLDGEYLLLGNTSMSQWTMPLSGEFGFYHVTAQD